VGLCVRPLRAHEWQTYRDLRLGALADAPDAFARTLAEEQGRSDAEWSQMLSASTGSPSQISLVAEWGERPVGLAYGRLAAEDPEIAHLYSMWVAPSARRSGVGRALVGAVVAWARSAKARTLVLQVTEGNAPAATLYERAGFARTEQRSALRAGSALQVRTMRLAL
jgi:ribosomal protein S18 acetylase RimI-like enzyme